MVRLEISGNKLQEVRRIDLRSIKPCELCTEINNSKPQDFVPWSHVYNRWFEFINTNFERHEDPLRYISIIINRTYNLTDIYYIENPFCWGGCVYKSGRKVGYWARVCQGIHRQYLKMILYSLEQFTVLVCVVGSGFNIVYLIRQYSSEKLQEEGIEWDFMFSPCWTSHTAPMFIFLRRRWSSKGWNWGSFGMKESLCKWHMKGTIKGRLKMYRKSEKDCVTDEEYYQLMQIDSRHFNEHPFLLKGKNFRKIRK